MKKRVATTFYFLITMALLIVCIAGCNTQEAGEQETADPASQTRTIVDMAGRENTVPEEINKVFCVTPVGTIITYTLAPERLVAWNYEMGEMEKKFILQEYRDLPNLGSWYSKGSCNSEEVLKIDPDIILFMGTMDIQEKSVISQADGLQKQLDIPVVLVNGELAELEQAYKFIGDLIGEQEKAQELGEYCRKAVAEAREKAQSIPQDKRAKVYYAEGANGLQTEPCGSRHTEVLSMVGGINVADVPQKAGKGMTAISLEQLILWNPELILSWGSEHGGYYDAIFTDQKWEDIQAVKNKRVYAIPAVPFKWFDRPPSVNQVIGLKWVGNLLYPDVFAYDMHQDTKDFYQKFYRYELTDEEVDEILKDSIPVSQ
jgi:iron complex transport system substrate-binding protein